MLAGQVSNHMSRVLQAPVIQCRLGALTKRRHRLRGGYHIMNGCPDVDGCERKVWVSRKDDIQFAGRSFQGRDRIV